MYQASLIPVYMHHMYILRTVFMIAYILIIHRRTTSSNSESSGTSGNTVESQVSADSTVQLEV